MDNFKTLFRLYRLYAKMDLLWFLRDTRYCLLQLFSDTVCACCTVAGVFLLSANFDGFGGMNQDEILFMMGFSILVDGLYMVFFIGNNAAMISRTIGRGQLDHVLIQPVPVWTELLAQGFSPLSGSSMLVWGFLLTIYAGRKLMITVTPLWLLLFFVYAVSSVLLIVSFMYLLSCAAFYAPAAAEEIAQVGKDLFTSLKMYPLGGIAPAARRIFLTVLPVGLASWFPARILLKVSAAAAGTGIAAGTGAATGTGVAAGTGVATGMGAAAGTHVGSLLLPFGEILLLPAVTLLFLTITLIVFKKGMKYYAVYGSPRYSGFGHR